MATDVPMEQQLERVLSHMAGDLPASEWAALLGCTIAEVRACCAGLGVACASPVPDTAPGVTGEDPRRERSRALTAAVLDAVRAGRTTPERIARAVRRPTATVCERLRTLRAAGCVRLERGRWVEAA